MKILSISIGELKSMKYQDRTVETGIFKTPVAGPVRANKQGLEGDIQVDRKNHGGSDKAIYVYTAENYAFWEKTQAFGALDHGGFGENLTVQGMLDDDIYIGDTFLVGQTVMQVTQPRVPCFKLGVKLRDPGFVARFLTSGRTGFYLRVLTEGLIQRGDEIRLTRQASDRVSIADAMKALISNDRQQDWIRRVLAVESLSSAWRQDLAKRLK